METVNEKSNRIWFTAEGKPVSDEFILSWIKKSNEDKSKKYKLIVGTDSHRHKKEFKFVTVICLYQIGRGGCYYYTNTYQDQKMYKNNLKARMMHEVSLSVEISNWLVDKIEAIPEIHIDASPKDVGNFTSEFSDQLKSYATSYGFKAQIKPNSWVANTVANKHSK
jgi:predicted RNase H-related nuclease YkuK (DUF458 family)